MMKKSLPVVGAFLAACFLALEVQGVAAEVRIGDPQARVREVLGEPTGLLETEAFTLLMFDRGTVRLENDQVVRIHLISDEQARKQAVRHQAQWSHAVRVAQERDVAERLAMAKEQEERARRREQQARDRQFRDLEERVRRAEEQAARAEREASRRLGHFFVHPVHAAHTVTTPVFVYPVHQTWGGSGLNVRFEHGRPAGSRVEAVFGHRAPMSSPGFRP